MLQVIIMASLFLVRWERTQGAVCRTGTDNMTPEKGNTILILLNFLFTVKVVPHECVNRTGLL